MKRSILAFLFAICVFGAYGQYTPFPTIDSLDINNIHASVLVHGDMWWDPNHHTNSYQNPSAAARCNWAGTNKNIHFSGSVWMSVYDAGNMLHVAAQTYRQTGMDYWPGPLESSAPITYTNSEEWAKIWKVNGTDVIAFNSITSHTTVNTPESILTWPGKGNVYARGNNGTALIVSHDMAPFVDVNGNGIYEPLLGEYPDFPGDQALWYLFNDHGPSHDQTNALPLGVEVQTLSYGYNRGTLLDNIIYYDYKVVNRSVNDYHNFRLGVYDDVDLGWYYDDFIGYDSARRLGICYNGSPDDGAGGGHPLNSFGTGPPMTGITFVSLPGDSLNNYVPFGTFVPYINGILVENPRTDTECNMLLRGTYATGHRFICDFQGPNHHPADTTIQYVFTFPGDPGDALQWSECSANNVPSDRRFILSTNDFDLPAGSSQHIVMAMVVTDTGVGGCPNTSFAKVREVSDTAWAGYRNPPTSLHKHTPTSGPTEIKSWPNPARDKVFITGEEDATIAVYNAMGQMINVPVVKNGTRYELDISTLPRGLYNAVYGNGKANSSHKFLKE